ncbi:kallikrein-4-like [Coccinella septempunctata]|uniref:kallikrein-4-like n=1 Tax=Coccinella septempunctata TaxID=41139 RepID=UPI001D08275D|nr:kallikrein-4-like [Coccinella septempunctata]
MTILRCFIVIFLNLSSSFSIYNGEECYPGNYTFLVQLVSLKRGKKTVICSGTLIKLDTVLTAAHCVLKFRSSIFAEPKIVLHTAEGNVMIGTKKIHIHEKYDKINLQYDVAILVLEDSFSPSQATTISLPFGQNHRNSTQCPRGKFLGWGNSNLRDIDELPIPSEGSLRCIDFPVISKDNCSSLRSLAKMDTFFCAFGGFERPGGGCRGDSGGPFLCDEVQYGIASVNFGCGVIGEPTFFTSVDKTLDFIERHVKSSVDSMKRNGLIVICLVFIIF